MLVWTVLEVRVKLSAVASGHFGVPIMNITIEATYENGVLKPDQPLPLQEHDKVRITVHTPTNWVQETAGIIPCFNRALVEWAAMDPELDYPPMEEP
jgi:predicted DNA-binding antitoxin AbrB/MazE fold protein